MWQNWQSSISVFCRPNSYSCILHVNSVQNTEIPYRLAALEHSQKGVTDRQTDGRTDRQMENTICRAAWTQLKTIGHIVYITPIFVQHFKAMGKYKLELQSRNSQFGLKLVIFFVPCDLEICWMTLKNNGAPLLYYMTLCTSFQSYWWIQTWVTVRKRSIPVKKGDFFAQCDLEIWRSFVHHFVAIGEIKLELQ